MWDILDRRGNITIDKIKEELSNHLGSEAKIKYSLGRNKFEEYDVLIKQLYNHVFIVEMTNDKKEVKSFSYSDIISKTVKIDYHE